LLVFVCHLLRLLVERLLYIIVVGVAGRTAAGQTLHGAIDFDLARYVTTYAAQCKAEQLPR
jgi:hypothetical protein